MRAAILAVTLFLISPLQAGRVRTPGARTTEPTTTSWTERRIALPIVGPSMAYVPRAPTSRVVLFLSGDGGWNQGVVDMARRIASQSIVVGISVPALVRAVGHEAGCWYPAGDLELLAHAAEKQLNVREYEPPLLVGYSSGATLVYAALAAAPRTTFAGGVSLGFCADLDVARPVCRAAGWSPQYDPRKHLSWLPRVPALARPWWVLHGVQDQVCSPADAHRFTAGIVNAHLVELAGTGHGFGRPIRWGGPFDAALAAIWKANQPAARPVPPTLTLAAIEDRLEKLNVPLEYKWPAREASAYLIFFSGDGGWAALDDTVASNLAERGIAVIGVSSLRYFWHAKTPSEVAAVLRRIVAAVGRPVFVGGYSFGAEVMPIALAALAPAERTAISGMILVGPGPSASFEIDPLDWVRTPAVNSATRVAPAVRELDMPTLCITGQEEPDSGCTGLTNNRFDVRTLPGGHHFDGNYTAIAGLAASFMERASGPISTR